MTSCKETRAVCAGKETNLAAESSDLIHSSAVNTLLVLKEPTTNDLLLDLINKLLHHTGKLGIFFAELCKVKALSAASRL